MRTADGQTVMTKLNRRFPQFSKRAKEKLSAYWCRILWQWVCVSSL